MAVATKALHHEHTLLQILASKTLTFPKVNQSRYRPGQFQRVPGS